MIRKIASATLVLAVVACGRDEPNEQLQAPSVDAAPVADAALDRSVADAREAGADAGRDVPVPADVQTEAQLPDAKNVEDAAEDVSVVECSRFDPGAKTFTPPGSNHPHCYWLHTTGLPWTYAVSSCEYDGGHLVTIGSAEENAFCVTELLRPLVDPSRSRAGTTSWLGLTDGEPIDSGVTGTPYVWITGEPVTYTKWAVLEGGPEPSNTAYTCGGEETCFQHRGTIRVDNTALTDTWRDQGDNQRFAYICEATLDSVTLDAGFDATGAD